MYSQDIVEKGLTLMFEEQIWPAEKTISNNTSTKPIFPRVLFEMIYPLSLFSILALVLAVVLLASGLRRF